MTSNLISNKHGKDTSKDHVKTEAETGVTQPWNVCGHQKVGEARKRISPRAFWRECGPADTCRVDFCTPEL